MRYLLLRQSILLSCLFIAVNASAQSNIDSIPHPNNIHFAIPGKANPVAHYQEATPKSLCAVTNTKEEVSLYNTYKETLRKNEFYKIWDLSKPWLAEPVLHVVIDRHGQLVDSAIVHSSGDSKIDSDSIQALKQLFPLPALPTELKDLTLEFILSPTRAKFDVNPLPKEQSDKEYETYPLANKAYADKIINNLEPKWKNLNVWHVYKSYKTLLVRINLIIYEETGEVLLKKVEESSCNPAYDNLALSFIKSPITKTKPAKASRTRILPLILNFKIN